jgi:hypothetical protein
MPDDRQKIIVDRMVGGVTGEMAGVVDICHKVRERTDHAEMKA